MLRPSTFRVLHESLRFNPATTDRTAADGGEGDVFVTPTSEPDNDLAMAIRLSELEEMERQSALKKEEQLLQEIIKLSLQEK